MASTSSITQIIQTHNNALCDVMLFSLFHMHVVLEKHLRKKLGRTCSNKYIVNVYHAGFDDAKMFI